MKNLKIITVCLFVAICASSIEAQDLRWSELQERGTYHLNREEYALARVYFKEATILAQEKYGLKSSQSSTSLFGQGMAHYLLGSYEEAGMAAVLCLFINKRLPQTTRTLTNTAITHQLLGKIQYERGEIERAKSEYKLAVGYMLQNRKRFTKDDPTIIVACLYEYAAILEESTENREPEIIKLRSTAREIEEETK